MSKEGNILMGMMVPLVLAVGRASAAAFTIDDWSLGSVILMPNSMVGDGQGSTTPHNPFTDTFDATWGAFSITTTHDFRWSDFEGQFLSETQQTAEGLNEPLPATTLDERLWITTTEAVRLSYSLEFSYNLPTDIMHSQMVFGVFDPSNLEYLVTQLFTYDTLLGTGPGMFSLSGEVELPANRTWNVVSIMEIDTSTGSSGIATGAGSIDLRLTPEPNSVFLVVLGGLLVFGRSTRDFSLVGAG